MRDNHINNNNNSYYKLFEALKLIRIKHTVLMQYRSSLSTCANLALRVSEHVTETIRNIARGVGIN